MRPLPGIRFDSRPAEATDLLPRMDGALFVGVAARGPLPRPVIVEDAAQCSAVFGHDVPLAWDAVCGVQHGTE